MSIVKLCENVVPGAESTFIEIDNDNDQEYYTVQYGGSGMTLPKGEAGKKAAIEEYLSNIRHQLESISRGKDIVAE